MTKERGMGFGLYSGVDSYVVVRFGCSNPDREHSETPESQDNHHRRDPPWRRLSLKECSPTPEDAAKPVTFK